MGGGRWTGERMGLKWAEGWSGGMVVWGRLEWGDGGVGEAGVDGGWVGERGEG